MSNGNVVFFSLSEICESLQCWKQTLAREVDSYGRTALHYAALAKNLGPVKLLLANSSLAFVPDNEGLYPVHIAAIAGNNNAVCKFMEICLNYDELVDNKRRNIAPLNMAGFRWHGISAEAQSL